MVYKVLVTEDEPVALRHICTLIERKCPDFTVAATADNGKSALELLETTAVDIVITDVKMPVMDGIKLAEEVREKYPDILVMLVSGYQDFEYARAAIQYRVHDYILKPVKPSAFQESMTKIKNRLDEMYYVRRNTILHELCAGKRGIENQEDFKRIFSHDGYYVALLRKNGLPGRFVNLKEDEIFSLKDEQMPVYGRDEMEVLYIMPVEFVLDGNFKRQMLHEVEKQKKTAHYYTLVIQEKPVAPKDLSKTIYNIYQCMDTCLVIGKNQILTVDEEYKAFRKIDNSSLSWLEALVKDSDYSQVRSEIKKYFEKWEKESRTQFWIEDKVRQMIGIFRKYNMLSETVDVYEYFLDEAFYFASDMRELCDNILQIFSENFEEEARHIKVDTPEFLNTIIDYMQENLSAPLSPQTVCSVFGISQTYLSRLFKKYQKQSFNKVLNSLRINKAKEIMTENPSLYIKEIALMVGYTDQFYFSRIFRRIIGISPKEYMDQADKEHSV